MGLRGPKKKPQEILDARGTSRSDRRRDIVKGELIQDISRVTSVKSFKTLKTKRAKDIFINKCNQLIALRLMEEAYIENLVNYAYYLDLVFKCQEDINKRGIRVDKTMYTMKGEPYTVEENNPHIKIMFEATKICNQIGALFGFSPVDRQKLSIQKPEESPFDKLNKLLK